MKNSTELFHELNQPLTAINTYVLGCIKRLENHYNNREQIIVIMKKILSQIEMVNHKVYQMINDING